MVNVDERLQDLAEIRSLMERSSRFLSLSGLSGVTAGVVALLGVGVAQWYLVTIVGRVPLGGLNSLDHQMVQTFFVVDAAIVFILAIALALFFSRQMAKRKGLPFWTPGARLMITELATPLGTGAVFCFLMMGQGLFEFVFGGSLLFYGVALASASRFTVPELRRLGFAEILLGFAALWFIPYALLLWATGFGLLHVVYGISVYRKYDRETGS
jgi:hypothetical protein